jgi:hypothetical protein
MFHAMEHLSWKNNTLQTGLVASASDGGPGKGCIR